VGAAGENVSYVDQLARHRADRRPALIHDRSVMSHHDLATGVARAAGWLAAQGVGAGEVIAVQMSREPAFLELHLAALQSGIATLPLNDRLTPAEVGYCLADSGARLAILIDETRSALGLDAAIPASTVRGALLQASPLHPEPPGDEAIALVCYTSGTTGRPKGALLTHANVAATAHALLAAWGWTTEDVLVHALPLYHIHGLIVAQHVALLAGARTVWLPAFEPRAVLDAIREHRATVYMGVPTHYHRLLATQDEADLGSMRLFTSGSAPLPARVARAFEVRFGHRILERYGMTEVGIVLSNPLVGERRPGSVGLPLAGVRTRVIDPETGAALPRGEIGELTIRGPSVGPGYLGRPEATAAALRDGWMHSGDLARIDPDGYHHIIGRRSDMVLVGGFNVYPREVEAVLCDDEGVVDAAVFGVPDPDLGERVVAAVVGDGLDVDALGARARLHLAAYKCPREIRLVDDLPRNAMGKVMKAALRRRWTATDATIQYAHDRQEE